MVRMDRYIARVQLSFYIIFNKNVKTNSYRNTLSVRHSDYRVFVDITLIRRFLKAYFLPKLNSSLLTSLTYLRITYTLVLLNFYVSIFW